MDKQELHLREQDRQRRHSDFFTWKEEREMSALSKTAPKELETAVQTLQRALNSDAVEVLSRILPEDLANKVAETAGVYFEMPNDFDLWRARKLKSLAIKSEVIRSNIERAKLEFEAYEQRSREDLAELRDLEFRLRDTSRESDNGLYELWLLWQEDKEATARRLLNSDPKQFTPSSQTAND